MNFEDAANILDGKTSRETLSKIEYYAGFRGGEARQEAIAEACQVAVWVLRNLHPDSEEDVRKGANIQIDFDSWGPCGECAPHCSWCKNNDESSKSIPKVCIECKHHSNYEPEYKFCCECGRPLTDEARVELKQHMEYVV